MEFYNVLMQQLANGLVISSNYALMAVGLTLVFGVLGVLNFAHGEIYMVTAYIAVFWGTYMGLNYIVASLLAILVVLILSIIIEKVAIAPLIGREPASSLISTYAVSIILANMVLLYFDATPQILVAPFRSAVSIGPILMTGQRIILFVLGFSLIAALAVFIKKTKLGKMIRAVNQNGMAASIVGINIQRIYLIGFLIAAFLAAVAGVLISPTSNVHLGMSALAMTKSFVIVVLGGMGNIAGAIVGGLVLGMAESLTTAYFASAWADLIGLLLMIVILLWKPSGLLGKSTN